MLCYGADDARPWLFVHVLRDFRTNRRIAQCCFLCDDNIRVRQGHDTPVAATLSRTS
jgi:hypothetical protein